MSATTYTITTSGAGLDRCPQPATVTPDGSFTGHITLAVAGADASAAQLTFTASAVPQSITITPKLGQAGGTVTVTGTNDAGLTDPAPATVTLTPQPKRRRELGRGGNMRREV
jgi:hypothetical protein